MSKHKLKEEILKPKDVDPVFLKRIEDLYGEVDIENDFFNDDLSRYMKTTSIDAETGGTEHKIINLASFGDSLKELSQALKALKGLSKTKEGKSDSIIGDITSQLKNVFNSYRTHIRKNYPEQYETIKALLDEVSTTGGGAGAASFTPGTGMQYSTPFAFTGGKKAKEPKYMYKLGFKPVKEVYSEKQRKWACAQDDPKFDEMCKDTAISKKKLKKENIGAKLGPGPKANSNGVEDNAYVNQFKYKLVPNKIKGSGLEVKQLFEDEAEDKKKSFQKERIAAFDVIEQELNDIYKMLSNAKNETSDYYKENPGSYAVVKPTDLVLDYIKDIKTLLKGEE
jgi:hypothetical protein